ncbi:MAG: hypothetical protein E7388_03045 [Ruminococcaceae bacterium]|nr:hypothetical protein [Oscillospiraceae bacterium]
MKAVIWEDINKLTYTEDYPEPVCKEDWVIIKVMSAGVCATDTHIITGKFFNGNPPHVLGHEICGVITEVGNKVTRWKEGDRVVVETAVGCGSCIHCLTANKHLCDNGGEIGFPPYQGGYSQYVTAPESCIHKIPDSMSFDEGGILEATVCPFGSIYRLGMGLNETVLVQGVGVAGLSFIQAVKCFSPAKVIAAARNPVRLEQAKKFGADVVINTKFENLTERVMEETGGKGVTLSIEAAGAPTTIENAVKLTAKKGRCILYGLPGDGVQIQFPAKEMIMNQITVIGVTNNELAWDPMMEMIASGKINIKDMVTHTFTLDKLSEAVDLVMERPDGLIKAVVHPWD